MICFTKKTNPINMCCNCNKWSWAYYIGQRYWPSERFKGRIRIRYSVPQALARNSVQVVSRLLLWLENKYIDLYGIKKIKIWDKNCGTRILVSQTKIVRRDASTKNGLKRIIGYFIVIYSYFKTERIYP